MKRQLEKRDVRWVMRNGKQVISHADLPKVEVVFRYFDPVDLQELLEAGKNLPKANLENEPNKFKERLLNFLMK